jgi:hypothetical protein
VKTRLKHEIQWRIDFALLDCSTFIRVRGELKDWYTGAGVGGGNFMMAQSLFSALNFLAKVYARLRHREKYFFSEKDKEAVKNAVRKLRAKDNQDALKELFPDLDFRALLHEDALTQWKPPRPGDCTDETKVFKMFVEAMSGAVDLGFLASDAGDVWRQFRNELAHMAAPKSMVESGGPTSELRSFRKSSTGEWICNVDRLTEDVQTVASWLYEKIEHESDEDRISDTLDWILDRPSTSTGGSGAITTTTTTSGNVKTHTGFHGSTSFSVRHVLPQPDPTTAHTESEVSPTKKDPNG